MTSEVMKNLHLNNVSIHIKFQQNRFINNCVRKKKAKMPEFRSFLVRYRRNYVIKNSRIREKEIVLQLNPFFLG